MKISVFLLCLFLCGNAFGALVCSGKVLNPIADTCWGCLFPIRIAGSPPVSGNQYANHDDAPPVVCVCPAPYPQYYAYGTGLSVWEAWRLVEVVRSPGCFPSLNGMKSAMWGAEGTNASDQKTNDNAYYHVHIFSYPIVNQVYGESIDDVCSQDTGGLGFDMLYATELDPLWSEDDLANILSPEAFLINTPPLQALCIIDTISASTTNFGLDALHWCSGSQGSVFPTSGAHNNHIGGVDSSLGKAHSFLSKLARQGMMKDTSTSNALCKPKNMFPRLRKNQFKQQAIHPTRQTRVGIGLGKPSQFWTTASEFPVEGEDFSYLIWRKRTCCAFQQKAE